MPTKPSIWTSREVHFKPFPRTDDTLWEAFFDDLADHYYDRSALVGRYVEPAISARGLTVHVAGLPWWMPGWWARRTVASIAARNGVGGSARFVVERTVLL